MKNVVNKYKEIIISGIIILIVLSAAGINYYNNYKKITNINSNSDIQEKGNSIEKSKLNLIHIT